MKKIYLIMVVLCLFKIVACKKDETPVATTPPVTTTPKDTTTTTPKDTTTTTPKDTTTTTPKDTTTTPVDTTKATPIADKGTFIIGGKTYVVTYTECLYPVSTYYYINGQMAPSYCKVSLKKKPALAAVYKCVNKPANTLALTESFIEIGIPDSTGAIGIWSCKSGDLNIAVTSTKATAFFNKVVFINNKTMATDTASAQIVCP